MSARDAVIVDAVRTPVGKRNGSLAGVHAVDLSAHVLTALVARNGIDPAVVDDVIWGCVQQVGQQAGDVARMAVLAAGWPESVPGTTIDRQCGSSQQSVHFAAAGLSVGDIGAFEVNEAFASVPLAWQAETGADPERLNPNGGAIAIGHPLGASGARLMTALVHHMTDQGIQYGLQTMCEGGGMANATIIERIG